MYIKIAITTTTRVTFTRSTCRLSKGLPQTKFRNVHPACVQEAIWRTLVSNRNLTKTLLSTGLRTSCCSSWLEERRFSFSNPSGRKTKPIQICDCPFHPQRTVMPTIDWFPNTRSHLCAVILAASRGARLFPMTSSETPKHLLPIAGIPSILRPMCQQCLCSIWQGRTDIFRYL